MQLGRGARVCVAVVWPRLKCSAMVMAIVVGAFTSVGSVISYTGSVSPQDREIESQRFCDGKCWCDGGSRDRELMRRVCPVGWDNSPQARDIKKRWRERVRNKHLRRLREAPPPTEPPQVPAV